MSKSDERHKEKLAKRDESRRKHFARQEARADRDAKLRKTFSKYKEDVQRIWADWRATT
jgi:hypothetical protein